MFLRALRWRVLLQSHAEVPVSTVFWATCAGYFGNTCPTLVERWEAAIAGLAAPFLRELCPRLRELDEAIQQTKGSPCSPSAQGGSTEPAVEQSAGVA